MRLTGPNDAPSVTYNYLEFKAAIELDRFPKVPIRQPLCTVMGRLRWGLSYDQDEVTIRVIGYDDVRLMLGNKGSYYQDLRLRSRFGYDTGLKDYGTCLCVRTLPSLWYCFCHRTVFASCYRCHRAVFVTCTVFFGITMLSCLSSVTSCLAIVRTLLRAVLSLVSYCTAKCCATKDSTIRKTTRLNTIAKRQHNN